MRVNVRSVTIILTAFFSVAISLFTFSILFDTATASVRIGYPFSQTYRVSSPFGPRIHPITGQPRPHRGIDIAAPSGTPVLAARDGQVIFSGSRGGYGNLVEIQHNSPSQRTRYAHLSQISVTRTQYVKSGNIIGRVGATGSVTGPHLHLELLVPQGSAYIAINPAHYLGEIQTASSSNNDYRPQTTSRPDPLPSCLTAIWGCEGPYELPRCSELLWGAESGECRP